MQKAQQTSLNNCTLWLTGLSGAGKTTLSEGLKAFLEKNNLIKSSVFLLDGDIIRKGLNKDLGFSAEARTENIRRISEVSKLFNLSGQLCMVSFISPYAKDREFARRVHNEDNLRFYEIFISTSLEECESRDPKGLYKKARKGEIPNFTGISDPYEAPENPDLNVHTDGKTIDECIKQIARFLNDKGVIQYEEKPQHKVEVDISNIDAEITLGEEEVQLLQVLEQEWAGDVVKNFMNEEELLEVLHFNKITRNGKSHLQSVPIICPITAEDANKIKGAKTLGLKSPYTNKVVAVLTNPSTYKFRKEEISARVFGTFSQKHPKIQKYYESNAEFLLTGEHLKFVERIVFNDGLDNLRLSPVQIKDLIKEKKADTVFAFQLRNPLHNGHILLLNSTREQLIAKGYKNPILLLHPLGGWVKDDDVPLDVRMRQHEALLEEGVLNAENTILAVWPSPMFYGGPTEVMWHMSSRINAGVDYMIVGRDPAGVKHPEDEKQDLYDPTHGQRILDIAGKTFDMIKILPFKVAVYNKVSKAMEFFDESKKDQYDNISGTRMRTIAKEGVSPPEGFMNEKGWDVLAQYYKKL